MKRRVRAITCTGVLLCCAAALCTPALAAADMEEALHGLSAGVAYDASNGKYGSAYETKISSITFSLSKDAGDFTFAFLYPYLSIYAPVGSIIVAGKPVLVGGKPVLRNGVAEVGASRQKLVFGTDGGVGDSDLSATYFFKSDNDAAPLVDVKFNVKLNTGNSYAGLGTGKRDYSLQGDISQSWGKWTAAAAVSYTDVGKISLAELKNYYLETIDLSYKFGQASRAGLLLNNGQATAVGSAPSRDLSLYYDYDIGKLQSIQAYLLKGLRDGSPDHGAGLNFNASF